MRLHKNAGNQWKSCWRQLEMFNRESERSKNQAENKTRECFALVNELECLARELENAKEDIKKFISRAKTEETSVNIIQRRLEARKVQSPVGHPPYQYELLFLPKGGNNHHNSERVQNIISAVSSGQRWSARPFQEYFADKKCYGVREFPGVFMIRTE